MRYVVLMRRRQYIYIDDFVSKAHNSFISEPQFIAGIDRDGHAAQCVKILHKSRHQKFVKNAVCHIKQIKIRRYFDQCFVSPEQSRK